MERSQELYQSWLEHPQMDAAGHAELVALAHNPEEIEERFYQDLHFGTAGLRGILGLGTNRMNRYTVARAAEGFARYIQSRGEEACQRGIAISYDSRHYSWEFAQLSARIFAMHGIQVRLSDELRPVPLLSFAIRHFSCVGGICLTASHNPKEYNGFKAYGEDGAQIPVEVSDLVVKEINSITDPIAYYHNLPSQEEMENTPYWKWMGQDLDEAYDKMAMGLLVNPQIVEQQSDLEIIYSPLHGSGNKPIRRLLRKMGFTNVTVVPEQELPNGDFPTAPYPNPEDPAAMQMGIQLAKEREADIFIATDPDSDRMGVALRRQDGEYVLLSGNQIGVLLLEYILSSKSQKQNMPAQPFVVSTVVSSRLPEALCRDYGVDFYRTLTGFKNIAEVIKEKAEQGSGEALFSYEESFGYLIGKEVRDKDAVSATMLMAELAATAAAEHQTVYERLQCIFEKYGYAAEKTVALKREGIAGREKIAAAMARVRAEKCEFFKPLQPRQIEDYLTRESWNLASGEKTPINLPASDVLVYDLGGGEWFATRPSGTEPKLKIYMGSLAPSAQAAQARLAELEQIVATRIAALLD